MLHNLDLGQRCLAPAPWKGGPACWPLLPGRQLQLPSVSPIAMTVSLTPLALESWTKTVPTLSKWGTWSSEPLENYCVKHRRIARIFGSQYTGLMRENSFFRIFRKNILHSSNVETVLKSRLELRFCARLLLNILCAHGITSSRRSLGKT